MTRGSTAQPDRTSPAAHDARPAAAAAGRLRTFKRRLGVILRYAMAIRVQLIAGALFLAVLVLPRTPLWSVVGNMFVVRPFEMGVLAFAALFGGWFVVNLTRVGWAGAPDRLQPQRFWDDAQGTFDSQPLLLPFGTDGWTAKWPRSVPEWLRQWGPALALAAPAIGLAAKHTWAERAPETTMLGGILAPLLCGLALFVFVFRVVDVLYQRYRARRPVRVGGWFAAHLPRLGPGYVSGGEVRPEQRFSLVMLGVLAVIYFPTLWLMQPSPDRPDGCVAGRCYPVVAYAVLVVIVLTAVLAGLTFLLDYWRIPTLGLLLAVAFVFDRVGHMDHTYRVTRRQAAVSTAGPDVGPRAVLDRIVARWAAAPKATASGAVTTDAAHPEVAVQPGGPGGTATLITVAASGGGITSAAWTTRVLTGLEQCYGDAFVRSMGVISGASGGSVGAMFYLAPRYPAPGKRREADTLAAVRRSATSSGLRAVAWGIAFPDLLRLFHARGIALGITAQTEHLDRAWALEQAWLAAWKANLSGDPSGPERSDSLDDPPPTLDVWRARVTTEGMPVSIFNAMTVEDGQLVLLTPGAMTNDGKCRPPDGTTTFDCLYPHRDIAVVTAARLSASFPWVSPNARALPDDDEPTSRGQAGDEVYYHIIDGGLFDNSGSAAVATWLSEALGNGSTTVQVLPILIQWGEWQPTPPKDVNAPRGTLTSLTLPFKAMVEARSSTQAVANRRSTGLLRQALTARLPNARILPDAVFNLGLPSQPSPRQSGVVVKTDDAAKPPVETVPLSWQLSDRQMTAIQRYWTTNEDVAKAMVAVGTALGADVSKERIAACLGWEGEG